MPRILRAHRDEHTVKKLHSFALEHAESDEPIVLVALQRTRLLREEEIRLNHILILAPDVVSGPAADITSDDVTLIPYSGQYPSCFAVRKRSESRREREFFWGFFCPGPPNPRRG